MSTPIEKTYGSFIIHLSGLWIMNQTLWFDWQLLQAQINTPCQIDSFMIKNNMSIPPPPPPPPSINKYQRMLKMGIS